MVRGSDGRAALHHAAAGGHLESALVLLQGGASANQKTNAMEKYLETYQETYEETYHEACALDGGSCHATLTQQDLVSMPWCPDGKTIATCDGKMVKLWNAADGSCRVTLSGHRDMVLSVAWSPNGMMVATGSADFTVKLWDAARGSCHATLSGHTDKVLSVAWSPNGKTVATGSTDRLHCDGTAKLWDAADGSCRSTLKGHSNSVMSVAWSPDGKTVATASRDSTVKLWDAAQRGCSCDAKATLQEHVYSVHSVAWSPDGKILATASRDETVKLWDAKGGVCRATLVQQDVVSVPWSPDGKTVATCERNVVMLWDAASGSCRATLSGHIASVLSAAWSLDGKTVATGSADNTVKLWRESGGMCRATLRGHIKDVTGVAWSPDGNTVATCGGKTVKLWCVVATRLLVRSATRPATRTSTHAVAAPSPLHLACVASHYDVVRLLLEAGGANVCAVDGAGRTPLHAAALRDDAVVCRLLLCRPGVDAAARDAAGKRAAELATDAGVRALLSRTAEDAAREAAVLARCTGLTPDEVEWLRCWTGFLPATTRVQKLDKTLANGVFSLAEHAGEVTVVVSELITAATVGAAMRESERTRRAAALADACSTPAAQLAERRRVDSEADKLRDALSKLLVAVQDDVLTADSAAQRATQACAAASGAAVRIAQLQCWELFDALRPSLNEGPAAAERCSRRAAPQLDRAVFSRRAARALPLRREGGGRRVGGGRGGLPRAAHPRLHGGARGDVRLRNHHLPVRGLRR